MQNLQIDEICQTDLSVRITHRIRTKRQTLTIDVQCREGWVRECSLGEEDINDNNSNVDNNINVDEDKEICAEYNVRYDDGDDVGTVSGVFDAEVCRAKCIQDRGCKFWTWGEDRKCRLIG